MYLNVLSIDNQLSAYSGDVIIIPTPALRLFIAFKRDEYPYPYACFVVE
jgi:hypothetical protein